MTNQQLAIILHKYSKLLGMALDKAEEELPKEAKSKTKPIIPFAWVKDEWVPALEDLYGLKEGLDMDIKLLQEGPTMIASKDPS